MFVVDGCIASSSGVMAAVKGSKIVVYEERKWRNEKTTDEKKLERQI